MDQMHGKNGILIHHWDTDGMCSAALLLRELGDDTVVTTFTPTIGNYYLNEGDREELKTHAADFVAVVDMALPKDSIEFLNTLGPVYIFDHHLQDKHDVYLHLNPIIDGGSPKKYPSASWVVGEYLDNTPDLLFVLGAFGDRERKLLDNGYTMKVVDDVLDSLDTDFGTILELVELLDSNYKLGNKKEVERTPWFLMNIEDHNSILNRRDLHDNVIELNSAIECEVNGERNEIKPGVLYREMDSPYNIISTVTRKIAWANEDKIAFVVNERFMDGSIQIYIRGTMKDSQSIIESARKKGYSAGGKSDVVGMVIPKEDKEFIQKILEMLE